DPRAAHRPHRAGHPRRLPARLPRLRGRGVDTARPVLGLRPVLRRERPGARLRLRPRDVAVPARRSEPPRPRHRLRPRHGRALPRARPRRDLLERPLRRGRSRAHRDHRVPHHRAPRADGRHAHADDARRPQGPAHHAEHRPSGGAALVLARRHARPPVPAPGDGGDVPPGRVHRHGQRDAEPRPRQLRLRLEARHARLARSRPGGI
ncbi:MAG: hypothetical protein AVDCRST_MAG85-3499, partial [uncultured Solirubrobacteraceae bacterium]